MTLNKVIYLPNCPVNIFRARTLLGNGDIRIVKGNLVINRKGEGLFRFDRNIMIIEEPKQYTLLVVTQKKPSEISIRLQYRRFSHLGLKNVRKTLEIVKGMILKEESVVEDDRLRLYDPCERGKPLRYIRKKASLRNLKIFDEVHIDIVIMNPLGINNSKYGTIFIEKASSVRQVYFYQSKNRAYDVVVKYQKIVKT